MMFACITSATLLGGLAGWWLRHWSRETDDQVIRRVMRERAKREPRERGKFVKRGSVEA